MSSPLQQPPTAQHPSCSIAGASSRSLQTSLELNSQTVFKSYSHAGVSASDVTINLKDLKALLGLCLELGADVSLKFDKAGLPLLAVPHLRGAQVGMGCVLCCTS
jgi:hypothetical protein